MFKTDLLIKKAESNIIREYTLLKIYLELTAVLLMC